MRAALLRLAIAFSLAGAGSAAQAQDYVYMYSAGEMRSAIEVGNQQQVAGYIAGVMDSMMRTRDFCVPEGTSLGAIRDRAYTLMAQQPRESMAPAADVLAVFLHADYPCK